VNVPSLSCEALRLAVFLLVQQKRTLISFTLIFTSPATARLASVNIPLRASTLLDPAKNPDDEGLDIGSNAWDEPGVGTAV
jgi:hypothetical protein